RGEGAAEPAPVRAGRSLDLAVPPERGDRHRQPAAHLAARSVRLGAADTPGRPARSARRVPSPVDRDARGDPVPGAHADAWRETAPPVLAGPVGPSPRARRATAPRGCFSRRSASPRASPGSLILLMVVGRAHSWSGAGPTARGAVGRRRKGR